VKEGRRGIEKQRAQKRDRERKSVARDRQREGEREMNRQEKN